MSTHTHIQFESKASVASDALDLGDPEIVDSIKRFNDKTPDIDWMLISYVKGSNRLKLEGNGNGGLSELVDNLEPGKAAYGLLRFQMSEERSKTLYITWVPDGVPVTIKGVVHAHVNAVAKILKPFHVQINARTEEDLDEDTLRQKCERSAGARY